LKKSQEGERLMERHELTAKLQALEPGECLSVPLYTLIALFGSTGATFDKDAMRQSMAFAEQHSCRFLYYEYEHRDPEFFKTV
jgi:hypothetical protein